MRDWIIRCVATGLFTGYSPFVSGTVGTFPAWILAYFVIGDNTAVLAVVTLVTTLVSIWAATEAEKQFGHDSKKIVIDEWAGMFVSLLLVPYSLTNFLIALVAFRVFDVLKIPPAAQAEKLPRGWGVTGDDIVAGIQANVATQLIILAIRQWQ